MSLIMKRVTLLILITILFSLACGRKNSSDSSALSRSKAREKNVAVVIDDDKKSKPVVAIETSAIPVIEDHELITKVLKPSDSPKPSLNQEKLFFPYHIKGLWTDFWGNPKFNLHAFNREEISGNGTGKIAVNILWAEWDLGTKIPVNGLCGAGESLYRGECFKIHEADEEEIKYYSDKNIEVTAIVIGPPGRFIIPNCPLPQTATINEKIFCAMKEENMDALERFMGMIASRYDGNHGVGKISQFVMGNEVNQSVYFNNNCGGSTPCNLDAWVTAYTKFFKFAHDGIVAHQPEAKVLISLDHAFGSSRWDNLSGGDGQGHGVSVSGETFLRKFNEQLQALNSQDNKNRKWWVAFHPYNTNLFSLESSPLDFETDGKITTGNIGLLSGWLRKNFPTLNHIYENIELTESGFSSITNTGVTQFEGQATAVCNSFKNILGTPGITGYILNRMMDHGGEGGLHLGLRKLHTGESKSAWATWALANRPGIKLDCGFENFPFTLLSRSYSNSQSRHWISSRLPPSGYSIERSWKLLRAPHPTEPSAIIFECLGSDKNNSFLSLEYSCGGNSIQNLGPVGYIRTTSSPNLLPLYQCKIISNNNRFITDHSACENQSFDNGNSPIGYAYPPESTTY